MGMTYDDFIRTTSDRHKQGVQALFGVIRDNGYIYKGSTPGSIASSTNSMWMRSDRARLVPSVDVRPRP